MQRDSDLDEAASRATQRTAEAERGTVQTDGLETRNMDPQHSERNRAESKGKLHLATAEEAGQVSRKTPGKRHSAAVGGVGVSLYTVRTMPPVGLEPTTW